MKILFKKLEVKNFLSFGDEPAVFEYRNGIDLITAENGSGKSSLGVEAVYYALFGKPYRKIKLGSLINNINNRGLLVKLDFCVGDDEYLVARGMKPNIFEIYKNGELVNQTASAKDNQNELIEEVLGVNETSFKQLVVLGANVSGSKAFLDLNQNEREEVFQMITDTEIFQKLRVKAKEKLQEIKILQQEKQTELKLLEDSYSRETKNIESLKKRKQEIEEISNRNLKQLEEEILSLEEQITKYQEAYEKVKLKRIEFDTLSNDLFGLKQEDLKTHKEFSLIQSKLQSSKSIKDTFQHCIGCEKFSLLGDNEKEVSKIPKLEKELEKRQFRTEEIASQISELETKINVLKPILEKGETVKQNLLNMTSRKNALTEQLQISKMAIQESTIEIDETYVQETLKEIEEIKSSNNKLSIKKDKFQKIESLLLSDKLKGIVLSTQLPLFNKYLNSYLESFSEVSYNIFIDEELKEKVITRGEIKEYNSLSNGEKMRISFAILFAFHKMIEKRNAVSTNLLVLDEVLDSSADYSGREELMKILREDFSKDKDIVIVSHNPEIASEDSNFDRIIKIKKKMFSSIEIQGEKIGEENED